MFVNSLLVNIRKRLNPALRKLDIKESNKGDKTLVVIPDWGLAWNLYCLEYAVKLSKRGKNVSILDLSSLNPKVRKRRLLLWLISLGQTNTLKSIKTKLSSLHGISFSQVRYPYKVKLTVERQNQNNSRRDFIFRRAMASKYAAITGRSDTHLSQIPGNIVSIEREFFDHTLKILLQHHKVNNYSEIVTVNGRYVVDGAVVQFCSEQSVPLLLLEGVSAKAGRYAIYDSSPHDLPNVHKMQVDFWNSANCDRIKIAERGLSRKLSGKDSPGIDFRSNFNQEYKQPENIHEKKVAVYFPSSDREFSIFPEFVFRESFGGSQAKAFRTFSRIAQSYGYHVIVRTHPVNSRLSDELQAQYAEVEDTIWKELCSDTNSEFIESRSKINSHDLLLNATICATYASSISVESILQGRPTIILGESSVSYLVPEICAFSEEKLINLFEFGIPIIHRSALYPYGYWLEASGIELELFEFVSDSEVYYEGKRVNESRIILKLVRNLRDSLRSRL